MEGFFLVWTPHPSGNFFFQFWHLRPPPLQNFQWPCGVGVWKFFGTTHWLKNVWLTNQNLLNLPIVCLLYPASNNILRLTQMFLLPFSDIWKVDEARFWFYLRWQHKELQILDASFFQLFMLFIICSSFWRGKWLKNVLSQTYPVQELFSFPSASSLAEHTFLLVWLPHPICFWHIVFSGAHKDLIFIKLSDP